jgi:general secretion pathway protein C
MNLNQLTLPSAPTVQKWLPNALSALLAIGIAYVLVSTTWLFIGESSVPAQTETAPELALAKPTVKAIDYSNQIKERHLFGVADISNQAIDAPETKLDLKLLGVFAVGEDSGVAIIASSGTEEAYAVGETLPGNATLKAVYSDHVLLESSRGLETLRLPQEQELFKFTDPNKPVAAAAAPAAPSNQARPAEAPVAELSFNALKDYRQRFIRNPASLSEVAQVEKYEENGSFKGYKVNIVENNPLLQALGLQNGDVVTSVNEITLDKPENGVRALRKLMKATEFQVTVLRNGQEQRLQLQLH